MKTRLLSGWKTRAHVLCLAALCGLMTMGVAASAVAQASDNAEATDTAKLIRAALRLLAPKT